MSTVATGNSAMEFLYCFANTSLTQRVLDYLLRQMKLQVDAVTVIFLNDCWVVQLKLDLAADAEHWANCWAVLNENGIPYQPTTAVALALRDLRAGCSPIEVMNRHHLSIVSHGQPQPDAVDCFQEIFVAGLGYCPPSLI
ncbi:MAG: hypothetical protein EA368_10210 [Leptolyngbya sp. DLM2.Bin27]|nr:MAG: hypothetical protein EA368_10210 [Leptolyngbya sp. DLM2.Bin27]